VVPAAYFVPSPWTNAMMKGFQIVYHRSYNKGKQLWQVQIQTSASGYKREHYIYIIGTAVEAVLSISNLIRRHFIFVLMHSHGIYSLAK
jgi:hypothetical protein